MKREREEKKKKKKNKQNTGEVYIKRNFMLTKKWHFQM